MSKPVCVWDITIPSKVISVNEITKKFKDHCKKWAFSHERGTLTGYEHYQCRVSLKTKMRLGGIKALFNLTEAHYSITSSINHDNTFYVVKEDTRIGGPWTDQDPYIPKQVRDIKLYPFQQEIVDTRNHWDTRTINIIIDVLGNAGKTTLKTYVAVHKLGTTIPPMNDYKDLMRCVMCKEKSRLYLIDIPRAMKKSALAPLYSAIENIKDGYAFDDRYNFKEEFFDSPTVWVFTNEPPKPEWLTTDRWRFWHINKDHMLCQGSLTWKPAAPG